METKDEPKVPWPKWTCQFCGYSEWIMRDEFETERIERRKQEHEAQCKSRKEGK